MRKIGVICHDRWHPSNVIKQGLQCLSNEQIEFEFIEQTSAWSADMMDRYDVIILAKMNCKSESDEGTWLTEEIQSEFVSYVASGKGLLVIHAGTVGYEEEDIFCSLVGGVFTHHPDPCEVTLQCVNSPIWKNRPSVTFKVQDEHYFVEMTADDVNVFMTSHSIHGEQPAGWIREQGQGKVCVLTPGHELDVWVNSHYSAIIDAALTWCL